MRLFFLTKMPGKTDNRTYGTSPESSRYQHLQWSLCGKATDAPGKRRANGGGTCGKDRCFHCDPVQLREYEPVAGERRHAESSGRSGHFYPLPVAERVNFLRILQKHNVGKRRKCWYESRTEGTGHVDVFRAFRRPATHTTGKGGIHDRRACGTDRSTRPNSLQLGTGEMYPTHKYLSDSCRSPRNQDSYPLAGKVKDSDDRLSITKAWNEIYRQSIRFLKFSKIGMHKGYLPQQESTCIRKTRKAKRLLNISACSLGASFCVKYQTSQIFVVENITASLGKGCVLPTYSRFSSRVRISSSGQSLTSPSSNFTDRKISGIGIASTSPGRKKALYLSRLSTFSSIFLCSFSSETILSCHSAVFSIPTILTQKKEFSRKLLFFDNTPLTLLKNNNILSPVKFAGVSKKQKPRSCTPVNFTVNKNAGRGFCVNTKGTIMEKTVTETVVSGKNSVLDTNETAIEAAERIALMVNAINAKVEGRTVKALTAGSNMIQVSFDNMEA